MTSYEQKAKRIARIYEAFDRGEATQPLIEETFHADVEFSPLASGQAGGRTYRGYDGLMGFFSELHGELKDVRYEPPEFHDCGDAIVAFTHLAGTERQTSHPFRQDLALVYEFSGDLVRSVTAYETPAEALEAVERGHADA